MPRIPLTVMILSLLLAATCGGVGTSNPPPVCTGTSCACAPGQSCDVSTAVCGGSCTLACGSQAVCKGACGDSCSVDCGESATCAITVGPSGSISCKGGSTCDVTCVGDCSLSCADSAVCRLKCSGETAFTTVSGGAGC